MKISDKILGMFFIFALGVAIGICLAEHKYKDAIKQFRASNTNILLKNNPNEN